MDRATAICRNRESYQCAHNRVFFLKRVEPWRLRWPTFKRNIKECSSDRPASCASTHLQPWAGHQHRRSPAERLALNDKIRKNGSAAVSLTALSHWRQVQPQYSQSKTKKVKKASTCRHAEIQQITLQERSSVFLQEIL